MSERAFVFAGGGTGGHIFPAIAILGALRDRLGQTPRAVFLCSERAVDREILEREGAEFVELPAASPGMSLKRLAAFAGGWGPSVRASRGVIKSLKNGGFEVSMVTTGGFVAAPAAQGARVERVPVHLVNLDHPPGRANRLIMRYASCAYSASLEVEPAGVDGRVVTVRPIVRPASLAPGDAGACRAQLGLESDRDTLLVLGGSQGARTINRFVTRLFDAHGGVFGRWQVVHQAGREDVDAVRAAYAQLDVRARVEAFFDPVGSAWGAATLAICRGGAGMVAEAWANRAPAVFMPYPFHKDAHQRHNAAGLVGAGGALVLDDLRDPEANLRTHGGVVAALAGDASRVAAMRASLCKLPLPDGAGAIAARLIDPTGT